MDWVKQFELNCLTDKQIYKVFIAFDMLNYDDLHPKVIFF